MKKRLFFLLAAFLLWLPLFAVQKPAFMLYNLALAGHYPFYEWLQVIWHGLKLDACVAGYLSIIPWLCVLLSIRFPGVYLKKILSGYYMIVATLIGLIFAVDMALYAAWGFRIDATVFFYAASPGEVLASITPGLILRQLLIWLVYAFAAYWLFRRLVLPLLPDDPSRHPLRSAVGFLIFGGLLFLPIRGGVTTSTANVGMVYFSDDQFLNHSAINPVFSLTASLSMNQDFASEFNFFPEAKRAALVNPLFKPKEGVYKRPQLLNTTRPNLLLIVMESFSANTVAAVGGTPGVTPNMNRLAQEGVLFTNFYANSFRTDRGLVAVLNGYPAQPTTSIMKYPAKSQTLPSICKSLTKAGYATDMLYGGDINFTNMKSYFFGSGYDKITSDKDFPIHTRLSKWGANDDVTFDRLYHDITARDTTKPWFTTFLTLSSHEPFEVPYHRLKDPYLNAIAFTDSCLGHFVDRIKQTPAWNKLLIVLVADHGYLYPDTINRSGRRRFHIPMLWLGGALAGTTHVDTIACQMDIAPTLLGQMDIPHSDFLFGHDLFDPRYPAYAFYDFPNGFGFVDSTGISVYDNTSNRPLIQKPKEGSEARLDKGKAFLQTLYDDLGAR
ncbi:MAG: sulfatase-like hydrolase/transferase [Tannerella sp.]|jgi:phosphoglycerol transferase MdoB-like AlkP superfamily enzyme|nr:sulfatase-like hydrolase/transferase [Tannerella sp.]